MQQTHSGWHKFDCCLVEQVVEVGLVSVRVGNRFAWPNRSRFAKLEGIMTPCPPHRLSCFPQRTEYQELQHAQQQGMRYDEEEKKQDPYAGEAAHEAVSRNVGLQQYMGAVYGQMAGASGVAALGAVGALMTPLGDSPLSLSPPPQRTVTLIEKL